MCIRCVPAQAWQRARWWFSDSDLAKREMKRKRLFLLWMAVGCAFPQFLFPQCNGDTALCNRRFDQVCFLYTHNAYNYRGAHRYPNQNLEITAQLAMGVRGMMLDIYWRRGHAMVYHQSRLLGHRPLQDDLAAIKTFLDSHPREVMSIIFESYITPEQLAGELGKAGLLPYLHAQQQDLLWPTLQAMIANGRRLVIFSEKDRGNPYPWLHHVWDHATENDWSNHSNSDFDTGYNRGDSTNQLFLLNHFITHKRLGYGLEDSARVANKKEALRRHALAVWLEKGRLPNFIAVDFVEIGDAKRAVDWVNSLKIPD
jgi:hypothetical protein